MANKVELTKQEVNEEVKTGGNGHKPGLKQKFANWLLRDVHVNKLYIGDHTTVIENDIIKMNGLASDPGTPAEGWLWFLAAAVHKLRFRDNTGAKDVGEGAAPGAHDLAGAQHNPDTLANLNTKVSDGTLDKNTDKRDPNTHDLAGAEHGVDTLANLNAKVSDADLANEAEVIKKDGSVAFTGDQAMGGNKLTGLGTPVAGGDAATKDHVDSVVQGLDWQTSVLDELADPPGTPATGDRYLVIATATGDWEGYEDDIAEWNGTSWDFTTPNKGFAVWIEDVGRQKTYNGTNWVAFGTTIDHGNLLGKDDDDHTQYLNETRHDVTGRHPLGSVVPHDALINLTEKAHGSLTDVGATDHHDNVNDPAAGEKAALPGTSGTPGAANKFVTDEDPRNTNARTPAAHDHSGETLNPEVINVGDIGFSNGFRMTEDKKYGVVLISPKGRKYRMVKC
ncbi:hypothetical protein ES706_06064 [subsurface metagenome]